MPGYLKSFLEFSSSGFSVGMFSDLVEGQEVGMARTEMLITGTVG